jgi:beta-N-acetylhexosaminidase
MACERFLPLRSEKKFRKKMKNFPLLVASICFLMAFRENNISINAKTTKTDPEKAWVDSIFNALTPKERLGQLMMIRAASDKDAIFEATVEQQIRDFAVGGICFFQGTPENQAILTNRYQAVARLPLLVSMDAEWGLGMRLKESTMSFPKQLMLGAIQDNTLIYDMGREIARQCLRLGVQVNFAPDVDINNNSANPVINERSFGEDRLNVAAKSFQYMRGLQDGGVMACAKHFPGHGDTNVDSHLDLPVISHDGERLDSLELFPFRVLAQHGVASMMVAHLSVPAIDATPNMPTTLSERAIYRLLRKSIGFDGLIFTDAMEMKGVTKYFGPGEADVRALAAGNDIILLPENVGRALEAIQKALDSGTLDLEKTNDSVRRVLIAKYRFGLTKRQTVVFENIRKDLNPPEAMLLKRRLMASALTLVRDENKLIPLQLIDNQRFASVSFGAIESTPFQNQLGFYAPFDHFMAEKTISPEMTKTLLDTLKNYQTVVISIHQTRSKASDNFGMTDPVLSFLENLKNQVRDKTGGKLKNIIVTAFGNPYSLRFYDEIPTVLLGFTEDENAQNLAAQALFGAIPIAGKLPVTASARAKFAQGIDCQAVTRLRYDLPESVGMSSDSLKKLDELTDEIVRTGAAPGGQLLIVKDNVVVYQKAWGFHTYDQTRAVKLTDLYDLASITKVAATTISLMKLHENGQFDINNSMSQYIPELKAISAKQNLAVGDILAHQAGLQAWIPFYKSTLNAAGMADSKYYRLQKDARFSVEVGQDLWMRNDYVDTIWQQIFKSPLRENRKYVYSDLTMYLGARAVKNISGNSVNIYADQIFYRKLGLSTMTYLPLQKFAIDRCVPTEEDNYFRHQRIQGHVHDMGAAQIGGVSGHAGLFSNANDLAILHQMLLNGGEYGGEKFLKKETINLFHTRYNGSSRRGLGFDMKETEPGKSKNMSEMASTNTWGHMGFTGNVVWVDSDKNLIFIFLSNRTYPSMENNKLINGDFRPRAQTIVYKSILGK